LLWILGSLGILIIVYAVVKQLFGFSVDPVLENRFFNIIVVSALMILLYNRKLTEEENAAAKKNEEIQAKSSETSEKSNMSNK